MEHPVNVSFATSLKRSRLRSLFKGFLIFPHIIFLMAWTLPVGFASWWLTMNTLFLGRAPEGTYAYVLRHFQYQSRIAAWSLALTEGTPPYNGTDPYETTTTVQPPEGYRQRRLGVLFRGFLVLPSIVVAYGYLFGILFAVAIAGLAILFLGRVPEGRWRFLARAHVYMARLGAYMSFLTDQRPRKLPAGEPSWQAAVVEPEPYALGSAGPIMAGSVR